MPCGARSSHIERGRGMAFRLWQAFCDEGGGGVRRMKKVASLNDTKALDQQYKSGKGLVLVMVYSIAQPACVRRSHLRFPFPLRPMSTPARSHLGALPRKRIPSWIGASPLRPIPTSAHSHFGPVPLQPAPA